MTLIALLDFTGRLHPALVHLPIGLLLLACFFQLLSLKPAFYALKPAIALTFFLGMITAILSCVTGYILSLSGEYDDKALGTHQWMGITTAIVALMIWLLIRKNQARLWVKWIAVLLILLIGLTGHLGGSLTHGEDYLSFNVDESQKGPAIPPIPNIQQAAVYASAVEPLLKARCYSCHSAAKIKGKLRLDGPDYILKGGEDGKVIVPGKADESKLMDRLQLPVDDEDHMPPKNKAQLTATEVQLLNWWISNGADFKKTFGDFKQDEKTKNLLAALQTGITGDTKKNDLPAEEVGPPNERIVGRLKAAGVTVLPVSRASNYLSVTFINAPAAPDSLLKLLPELNKQLISLDLSNTAMDDEKMKTVSRLSNLFKLNLTNTKISDRALGSIANYKKLKWLNLVGDSISSKGLGQLKDLKELKSLFLYHTAIEPKEFTALQTLFPGAVIDTGGYVVPVLPTDTTEIKY